MKVGVLPFADSTASGNASVGASLGQLTQAEIVHTTQLTSKVIDGGGVKPGPLDGEKVVALGQQNGVDMIVLGTVLEARVEDSSQSGMPRSILGQAIGASLHTSRATVTLQADIYDVHTGKKIDSLRISQTQTDRKLSGTAYTTLGAADVGGSSFQDSTLGKALHKAIADVVKQINADTAKVTPATIGSSL